MKEPRRQSWIVGAAILVLLAVAAGAVWRTGYLYWQVRLERDLVDFRASPNADRGYFRLLSADWRAIGPLIWEMEMSDPKDETYQRNLTNIVISIMTNRHERYSQEMRDLIVFLDRSKRYRIVTDREALRLWWNESGHRIAPWWRWWKG